MSTFYKTKETNEALAIIKTWRQEITPIELDIFKQLLPKMDKMYLGICIKSSSWGIKAHLILRDEKSWSVLYLKQAYHLSIIYRGSIRVSFGEFYYYKPDAILRLYDLWKYMTLETREPRYLSKRIVDKYIDGKLTMEQVSNYSAFKQAVDKEE